MPRHLALVLFLCPALASAQAEAPVRNLREAYLAALENSDAVGISEASILQAEALYRAALGGSFPELTARHQSDLQDRRVGGSQLGGSKRLQNEGMLRLSRSGLTGYRELAAIRAGKTTVSQRGHERRRAEQLLLADVAAAYYGLIQSAENAATTAQLLEFADKRLAEIKDRVRVGRAREADALAQEVQSQALRSQLEESRRQVQARSDLLAFLVRAPVTPVSPSTGTLADPPPLEGYLERIESRPDVAAARDAAKAAELGVDIARAAYFPEVGLQANYYGYRPPARASNRWDASATVSVPLFSFGANRAENASARAAFERESLALRAARRAAELDARNAHRDYASAARQLEIQRKSGDLARRDYRLQAADERRGLVTSIEVLQSLDRLNISGLAFNDVLVQARLAAIALETAAGAAPEEILK
ncbi:MAG: TolC family protein [Elusimicrobiota bacterium]|nr:TolC family protein [Elusimicrobiota bacterium]